MSEPKDRLDEFLSDPMIQLVMARDRVRPQEVRLLLERAHARSAKRDIPPAHVIAEACRNRGLCA